MTKVPASYRFWRLLLVVAVFAGVYLVWLHAAAGWLAAADGWIADVGRWVDRVFRRSD
jgi:hypothetical protein